MKGWLNTRRKENRKTQWNSKFWNLGECIKQEQKRKWQCDRSRFASTEQFIQIIKYVNQQLQYTFMDLSLNVKFYDMSTSKTHYILHIVMVQNFSKSLSNIDMESFLCHCNERHERHYQNKMTPKTNAPCCLLDECFTKSKMIKITN